MSVILAFFHMSGTIVMAGGATNNLNSYPLLIAGKVLAAIGDGSLDNAQHRIFSTYFAPGKGFAFSIGKSCSYVFVEPFVDKLLEFFRLHLVSVLAMSSLACH